MLWCNDVKGFYFSAICEAWRFCGIMMRKNWRRENQRLIVNNVHRTLVMVRASTQMNPNAGVSVLNRWISSNYFIVLTNIRTWMSVQTRGDTWLGTWQKKSLKTNQSYISIDDRKKKTWKPELDLESLNSLRKLLRWSLTCVLHSKKISFVMQFKLEARCKCWNIWS